MNLTVEKPLLLITWPVGMSPIDEPSAYGHQEWTDIDGNYYITLIGEFEPRKIPGAYVEFVDDIQRAHRSKLWRLTAHKRERALRA
jgi:hypothetical protein